MHSFFEDTIYGAYLADMQFKSKFNKDLDFRYELLIFVANMHGFFL